ncbi:MAG: hypothetical protein WAK51_11040 [Opitutaceae bacterium]
MDNPKVFISVGSNGSQIQRDATEIIFSLMTGAGLSPRQLEKNEWSSEQPLRAIRRVIEQCHGAVIVAFTRYEFTSGIERAKGDATIALGVTHFPTVWNQIEAALAYGRDIPLLVICEKGLREDGLLEGRYDWKIFWTDFTTPDLYSERFSGFLQSWKKLVDDHVKAAIIGHESSEFDITKLSLKRILGALTLPQLWALLAVVVSLLSSVAAVSYRFGSGKWPWH